MEAASVSGPLAINDVIYAELSVALPTVEALESIVQRGGFQVLRVPREALFLAGKAFLAYRRSGGVKTGVLPDFFIGAHAAVVGMPLLTRDARRYQSYFPKLALISPG
jgi:predicted nucleic acid-binding protein